MCEIEEGVAVMCEIEEGVAVMYGAEEGVAAMGRLRWEWLDKPG